MLPLQCPGTAADTLTGHNSTGLNNSKVNNSISALHTGAGAPLSNKQYYYCEFGALACQNDWM